MRLEIGLKGSSGLGWEITPGESAEERRQLPGEGVGVGMGQRGVCG